MYRHRNNMRTVSIVLMSCVVLSCGPIFYAPNATHVPLFTERKQIAATTSTADGSVQLDAAVSVTDHLMICGSGTFVNPKEDKSGNGGSANLIELGGGYYRPMKKFVIGATGLLGAGNMENHYPSASGTLQANLFRWGVQPYIGYTSPYFEGVLAARFVGVSYSSVKGQLTLNSIDQVSYLSSNSNQFFFEPSCTLRFGYRFIYFQLQDVGCVNVSSSSFPSDKNTLSAGFYFRYTLGKKK